MGLIQGNRGSFNDTKTIGFSPEISNGVFRLTMTLSDDVGIAQVLVHEQELEAPESHYPRLEGFAREMLLDYVKSDKDSLNVHSFVQEVESISQRILDSRTSALERKILELPEGSKISIHTFHYDKTLSESIITLKYCRYIAYSKWQKVLDEKNTAGWISSTFYKTVTSLDKKYTFDTPPAKEIEQSEEVEEHRKTLPAEQDEYDYELDELIPDDRWRA